MSERGTCPPCPHRRFEISVEVGADDWEQAARELIDVAEHILEHGPKCSSIMGGYSCNHSVAVHEYPEMTPERYQAELKEHVAFVQQKRKGRDNAS